MPMSYRDTVDALAARHAALEHELLQKTRELDQSARLLSEAKTRAKLPVLDNIRVASPCSADWAKMSGDDRTRHCGDCKKNVYNISELTRDEAEALIVAQEGRLCVRYFQRADGTILLKDCVVGVRRKRRRRVIVAGAAALIAGGAAIAFAKFREETREEHVVGKWADESYVQGGIGAEALPPQDVGSQPTVPEPPAQNVNSPPTAPEPEPRAVLGEWK